MTSLTFVMLSGTISFGVPMIVAIRELLMLPGPDRRGDDPPREPRIVPAPKPLPDCLLPRSGPIRTPAPVRIRVLEDA